MSSHWPLRRGDLLLRDAAPADVEQLLTFRNDPDVNRWTLRTHVEPDVFRRRWATTAESTTDHSCVAERDGEVVAMGLLTLEDNGAHELTPPGVEGVIGYIVDPRHAGRGVASELTLGLLEVAFDRVRLLRVTADVYRDNLASVRVLEKAGMRREQHGVRSSWHAELGWIDDYGYALLAPEWRGELSGLHEIRDASATVPPRRPLPRQVTWTAGDHATGDHATGRSERLTLGPATHTDVDQVLRYRNRPEVGRWMLQDTVDPEALRSLLLEPPVGDHSFVARLGDRVVGTCLVRQRDGLGQHGGRVDGCEAEIGYSLDPEFHGQGFGREIAAAGIDRAFAVPGVRRVTAGLYADNRASDRLLAGLGLRREQYGVADSWHPGDGWVDGETYAVLRREWRPATA